MRKTFLLGAAAALTITATSWATFSYRVADTPLAGMDIAALHRSVDAAALPIAPVADYHAP